MARKKKQEVILLHGNSAFTKDQIGNAGLVQGELVIEHGKNNVTGEAVTKIHTIDNTGAELATFIDEKAINKLVNAVETKVDTLETVVGNETNGLVKDVAANKTAISDLQDALGMGISGTGVTARVEALEGVVGDESKGLVKDVKDLQSDLNTKTTGIKDRLEAVEGKADTNADEITALKKTVNGEGEDTGLVGKVAANEEAIGTNAGEIAKLKEYVVDGYTPEGEGAEKVNGLLDRVTVLENAIGDADAEGSIVDKLNDAKTAIEALQDTVGDESKGLVKDVKDLQATVGDATKGLVKDVAANKTATETNATAIDGLDKIVNGYTPEDGEKVEGLVDKVAANKTAIETLEKQISTDIATELGKLDVTAGDEDKAVTKYVSYVEQTDGKISAHYETLDAANVAAKYPHGETAAEMTVQQALDKLSAQDEALGGQIEAVDARIDTRIDAILGSDKANDGTTQLTIREIANAELAKQLIPSGATEALDTLQEIAAWIQAHPEDAAAMNADIANLKTALAGYVDVDESGKVTVTKVKGVIEALALRLDNKDAELNNAINNAITALTGTITATKNEIDAYTVNGKKISENPSLVSDDIKMTTVVGAEQGVTEQTVQEAIAQVQANVGTAEGKITNLTAELNKVNVTGVDGVKVEKSDRTFTVSIEKIDAGSYDD